MEPFRNTYGVSALAWDRYSVNWFFSNDPNADMFHIFSRTPALQCAIKTALRAASFFLFVCEYSPGTSVASGLGRIVFGTSFCTLAFARHIWNKKCGRPDGPLYQDEAFLTGIAQVARGAIALLPFGNVVNLALDGASILHEILLRAKGMSDITVLLPLPTGRDGRPNPNDVAEENLVRIQVTVTPPTPRNGGGGPSTT